MGERDPVEVAGRNRIGWVFDYWIAGVLPGVIVAFVGLAASGTVGLPPIVGALAGFFAGLGVSLGGLWLYASPAVEFYAGHAELADGTIGSHDTTVPYDDVELVVRNATGDPLLGTETLLVVRSGSDPLRLSSIADPETAARAFDDRVSSPTEQVRAARKRANTEDEEVPLDFVWSHWPDTANVPASVVLSESEFRDLVDVDVDTIAFDRLGVMATYDGYDDFGDYEEVSETIGDGYSNGPGVKSSGGKGGDGSAIGSDFSIGEFGDE